MTTTASPALTIKSDGPNEWVVIAHWHGADRIVCRGSLFKCCMFRRDNS